MMSQISLSANVCMGCLQMNKKTRNFIAYIFVLLFVIGLLMVACSVGEHGHTLYIEGVAVFVISGLLACYFGRE